MCGPNLYTQCRVRLGQRATRNLAGESPDCGGNATFVCVLKALLHGGVLYLVVFVDSNVAARPITGEAEHTAHLGVAGDGGVAHGAVFDNNAELCNAYETAYIVTAVEHAGCIDCRNRQNGSTVNGYVFNGAISRAFVCQTHQSAGVGRTLHHGRSKSKVPDSGILYISEEASANLVFGDIDIKSADSMVISIECSAEGRLSTIALKAANRDRKSVV